MTVSTTVQFDQVGRSIRGVTWVFLRNRLAQQDALEWAIRLQSDDQAKRAAIIELLETPERHKMSEPWQTAWRLVEESWRVPGSDDESQLSAYQARRRVQAGDRSGALIEKIVDLVRPRLLIEPFSATHRRHSIGSDRPKRVRDLFSARLSSGSAIHLSDLKLEAIDDARFLAALGNALHATLTKGLDTARRIGWDGRSRNWLMGQLHRVYHVPTVDRGLRQEEPDKYHRGIAPSVKLLYAVVTRLAEVDRRAARSFARIWQATDTPIHTRLWAAIARDTRIVSTEEVSEFLVSITGPVVWDIYNYPEVAELRARRLAELKIDDQALVLRRLRKGPPRSRWPKEATPDDIVQYRKYWRAREFRRLELWGFELSRQDKRWLDSSVEPAFLHEMQPDDGFPSTRAGVWQTIRPENRFDELSGANRLAALETALTSSDTSWPDEHAEGAIAWIRQPGNASKVLADFEAVPENGRNLPGVLEQFGWSHSPKDLDGRELESDRQVYEAERVLGLLETLQDTTISKCIEGLSSWFYTWSGPLTRSRGMFPIWRRLWPLGVDATNARDPDRSESTLDSVTRPTDDSRDIDVETLNTPVGKLMEVFLRACPSLDNEPNPFGQRELQAMRDMIIAAEGWSGLIARYRLVESLAYFLRADRTWAEHNLLQPLQAESADALELWRALARRIHSKNVLEFIGGTMSERAVDRRLDRDTRQALVANLVVEILYALKEQRNPVVAIPRVQQMLRAVEDEVRAHGADTVRRFVQEMAKSGVAGDSAESLLRNVAAPFLRSVWPQETTLVTPGVSRALASLPAASQDAFADAVSAIERFLVPFDCWSLHEYGLLGEKDGVPRLSLIDNTEKARALLILLDKTIGAVEGAVVPHDLSDALAHLRSVSPQLLISNSFRRLAAAARRT